VLVALAMLRRRINSYESPIHRLHPELLSHIASHLATDDLVKTTHVSYHWRTVLLAYPSLWSTLDFAYPERASAFLTRSKSTAIHVFLRRLESAPLPLELLKPSAERIETLQVTDYTSQKELLLRTMASLNTLHFSTYHSGALPDEKTSLYFPALKSLFVDGIDLSPFSAPRLTRFIFSDWFYKKRAMDGLLDFLSNCPLLEELEIAGVEDFYIQRNHGIVRLPHLRAYTHYTNAKFFLQLYHMLSCPPSCSATFTCGHLSYGIADAIPPFQNTTFPIDVRRVKLKTRSMDCKDRVKGMVEIIDATHRRFRSTQEVVLGEVAWETALIDAINPLYPSFIKGLDARFIEILCVEELALWFYEESDRVDEALDHLENIKTLVLSDSAVNPYLHALVPIRATGIDEWRCLKLETLAIHIRYDDYTGEELLPTLCCVARERKAAGFPLKSVSVFSVGTRYLGRWVDPDLEELRRCIGVFELVTGDDALDWKVDDYFLDGLDHFRRD